LKNQKREADDFMFEVEEKRAKKEAEMKKKAYSDLKAKYETKLGLIEELEEKEFKDGSLTSDDMKKL